MVMMRLGMGSVVGEGGWDACCGDGIVMGTVLKLIVGIWAGMGLTFARMSIHT